MFDGNDDTKERPRRVEVPTCPQRRRRWLPVDKARIVAEAFVPGANALAVARRWQICPRQVYAWRREARAGLLPRAEVSGSRAFVPIVAASDGKAFSMRLVRRVASVEIEIAGAVLRVSGGDPDLLASVLDALRASALS